MKKTWKQLLGTLTGRAAVGTLALGTLMGPVLGQSEDDGVVVLGRGTPPASVAPAESAAGEGSVQLGVRPAGGGMPHDPGPTANRVSHESVFVQQAPTIHPGGVSGAGGNASSGGGVGYAVTQDPEDILFRVGRRNGDMYGVTEGFTSVSAYLSRNEGANSVWFVEPRLLLTDQGRGGLNLGLGQKAYYPDLNRVVSLSGWWDFDSGHEADYHQVGLSFEMIGQNLSLRSNANFVISRDEHQFGTTNIGSPIPTDDGRLVQQQLIFTEVAYNQADVEVSAPMPLVGDYGWEWGGGAYFLFGGDGRDATGVKGRVESQVTEDLWVNAIISSDRVFDTNVSVNLEFTMPHAPPSRWFRRPGVRDHLWTSVRRQYRVATDVVEKTRLTPVMGMGSNGQMQQLRLGLIDPNITDNPLEAFGGTGTSDDPWKSLADYMDEALTTQEQFGIIAVRSRNDETSLNLDTTIVLLNGQALLGEGVMHSLDGVTPIDIPTLDPQGMRPLLTNFAAPGSDVITLANNNQVSGFLIDGGGTGSGIVGDGVRGFNINQVEMNNVLDGIRIRSLSDANGRTGIVRDNVINGIGLGSPRGISIEHESGVLGLLVSNNTVSGFRGEDANQNGMLDPSEDANNNGVLDPGEDIDFDGRLDLSEDLNANGVLDAGFGLYVSADNGSTIFANDPLADLPMGVLDNTFNNNGSGMSLTALDGSLIVADIQRNSADGSTDVGEDANGNQLLDVGEDINGNGVLDFGAGFRVFADDATISLVTFTDNSASNGFGNGGTFQTLGGGAINVVNPNIDPDTLLPALAFDNNSFTNNDLDGLFVRADTGAIIFDQIQVSFFDGNGDDGLDMETDNAGTIFVRDPLLANSFSMNGDNGLEITSGIGGGVSLTIGGGAGGGSANIITGNGQNANPDTGAGVFLGTEGGVLNATFAGITSTNNNGSGAVIYLDGGEINIDGGIINNTFVDNREHGLAIINNNGGRLITPFVADNDFSNNDMAGLFLGGSGPAPAAGPPTTTALTDLGSVTRNNFNRDLRGDEGILIDASDVRIIGTLTQNTFIGRRPTTNANGIVTEGGAGRGIGGVIGGFSSAPSPGGLSLVIGTGVDGDVNTFQDNGDAHIGIEMIGNTQNILVVENGSFSDAFNRRTVGQPLGQTATGLYQGEGIHYVLEDTATLTGGVVNNIVSGNEGDGLKIEIAGNNDLGNSSIFAAAQLNDFVIAGNEFNDNGIIGDIDGDGISDGQLADGIEIIRRERGQFNDLLISNNLFTGNTENGISIASTGVDLLNLPNMRADTVAILNNEISGNLRDGVEFLLGADADLAVRMDNNLIVDNGFGEAVTPATSEFPNAPGDVGNGIEVREQTQNGNDSRSLTGLWTNNTITGNFDDGIDLSGRVGNTLVELTEDGVYTIGPPPPATMLPSIGLVRSWGLVIGDPTLQADVGTIGPEFNLIADNRGDGIDITAPGVATIGNNRIIRNGTLQPPGPVGEQFLHAGINIDGAERGPGQSGDFTGQFPTPDGDIDPDILAFRELFVLSNIISRNNGDGIELLAEPTAEWFITPQSPGAIETALTVVRNEITLNEGRGIDILQRNGDTDTLDRDNTDPDGVAANFDLGGGFATDITIIGNHIKGNQLEGIYVVQTIDNAQNQVDPSAESRNANGESLRAQASTVNMGDTPQMRLDIHENDVIGNGEGLVDFPASGLVIRVGTSGSTGAGITGSSPFIFRLANFFATSGFNSEDLDGNGLLDNDLDGDGFLDAAVVTGAGVSTSITQNDFSGNYGDDVLFQSFTDTVDPLTASGAWDDMMFTPMGYQADPLSRMDVIFSTNRVESIEANNLENSIGTSPGNAGVAQAGAYYNDADGVFKSRLANIMTTPGPFGSASRIRNATRFASRYLSGPFPLPPDILISADGGNFAYPGMGNSTFRVRGSGNFHQIGTSQVPFVLDDEFIFDEPELVGDPDLVDDFSESNGVFPDLPPGGLPWGWDDLEPGTPPTP